MKNLERKALQEQNKYNDLALTTTTTAREKSSTGVSRTGGGGGGETGRTPTTRR